MRRHKQKRKEQNTKMRIRSLRGRQGIKNAVSFSQQRCARWLTSYGSSEHADPIYGSLVHFSFLCRFWLRMHVCTFFCIFAHFCISFSTSQVAFQYGDGKSAFTWEARAPFPPFATYCVIILVCWVFVFFSILASHNRPRQLAWFIFVGFPLI